MAEMFAARTGPINCWRWMWLSPNTAPVVHLKMFEIIRLQNRLKLTTGWRSLLKDAAS